MDAIMLVANIYLFQLPYFSHLAPLSLFTYHFHTWPLMLSAYGSVLILIPFFLRH